MRKMLFVIAVLAVVVLGGYEVATAQENGTVPPRVWLPIVGKHVPDSPCSEQTGAFVNDVKHLPGSSAMSWSVIRISFKENPYPWGIATYVVADDPEMKEIRKISEPFHLSNLTGRDPEVGYISSTVVPDRSRDGVYVQFYVDCNYPGAFSRWRSEVVEFVYWNSWG